MSEEDSRKIPLLGYVTNHMPSILLDIDTTLERAGYDVPAYSGTVPDWDRMAPYWNKAFNMTCSLFHDLETAYKKTGDKDFAQWCADNFVPLRIVFKMAKLLPRGGFGGVDEMKRVHKLFRHARDLEIAREVASKPQKAPHAPRKTSAEKLFEGILARHREQEAQAANAKPAQAAKPAQPEQPAQPSPVEPAKPAAPDDVEALKARVAALEAELAGMKSARSKAGRKPLGDRAMNAAERMRRMRARNVTK